MPLRRIFYSSLALTFMYLEFFGFKEAPFSIAPDPRYLYMSERHREALAHLVYGLRSEGGFVLLTGEVGTGKTTVCRCLLEQVPQETEIALVLNPKLTAVELLATICDELRVSYPEGNGSIKLFVDRINARLLENFASGRRTVIIIDEAQNIEAEVLEQIRLLTNLETNDRKLLQIIMLGQPELRAKLARPELRQLAQRITARYHLEPLSRKETVSYIHHRLRVSGVGRPVFTPRALGRIYRLSGGIPRRINVLADRTLLGAYVLGREKADGRIVARAAREAFDGGSRPFSLRWGAAFLLPVAALLFLGSSYLHHAPPSASPRPVPIPVQVPESPVATKAVLDLPAGKFPSGTRRMAYDALFKSWNLTPVTGDPCQEAESLGFSCLERQDGFESLRRFNLPAVLTLATPEGRTFYATLTGLRGEMATFRLGSSTETIPVEALQTRWGGKYTLLWRRPPFAGDLRPGTRGEPARWLSDRLAQVLQLPPRDAGGGEVVLEGELLAQLKRFQFNAGLAPDGVAGTYTLILLDVAAGDGVPLLHKPSEVR